jgi:hypothetical protein
LFVCVLACCGLAAIPTASGQVCYEPTVTYHAPATTVAYSVVASAPVTTYYAPVTTYYAPATPVTTYYAPVPTVTAFYAGPVWVYDPTRILPRRRWQLVY